MVRKFLETWTHLDPWGSDQPDSVGLQPLIVHDQAGAALPAPPPPGHLARAAPDQWGPRVVSGPCHHHPALVTPHCSKTGSWGILCVLGQSFIMSVIVKRFVYVLWNVFYHFSNLQTLQWHTRTILGASWPSGLSRPHLQVVTTLPPSFTLLLISWTLSSLHLRRENISTWETKQNKVT